jgi:hypothetical protein
LLRAAASVAIARVSVLKMEWAASTGSARSVQTIFTYQRIFPETEGNISQ